MAITKKGIALEKALAAYAQDNPGWLGNVLEMMDSIASRNYFEAPAGPAKDRWYAQSVAIYQIRHPNVADQTGRLDPKLIE